MEDHVMLDQLVQFISEYIWYFTKYTPACYRKTGHTLIFPFIVKLTASNALISFFQEC